MTESRWQARARCTAARLLSRARARAACLAASAAAGTERARARFACRRARLAGALGERAAVARSHRQPFVAGLCAAVALALTGTGLALLPGPLAAAHLAFLGAAAAMAIALLAALAGTPPPAAEVARLATAPAPLLGGMLAPAAGGPSRLLEREARYRSLLDSQSDVILERGADGRLDYVNPAFCRTFGVDAAEMLGSRFEPAVIESRSAGPDAGSGQPRRVIERVDTAAGPRWFAWEEHRTPAPAGTGCIVRRVGRDISEELEARREAAAARAEAEAASRAKSRFLATLSHEMRTPMSGILGMADLLAATEQTPEQQTYTRAIEESARTLLELIEEILDLARIEAGKLELARAPIDLELVLRNAVELLAPKAHEKGLEIAWTIEEGLPSHVLGDEARLRQVVLNLVGNAIKFTAQGGIRIRAQRPAAGTSTSLAVSVEDTGAGIDREHLAHLFSEFARAPCGEGERPAGSGLGLAISRRLARAMGGDITVDSTPGRGSTFTAEVSLAPAEGGAPVRSRCPAGVRRALLASALAIERRALADVLAAAGLEVTEAAGPAAAEALAGHGPAAPDLVVIDAGVEPQEAGRLMQSARQTAGRPVRGIVLITARERPRLADFSAHGFDSYLVRPVRRTSVLALLQRTSLPRPQPAAMRQDGNGAVRVYLPQRPCRILLAEDNPVNALLARTLITKAGCDCIVARDGFEAIAAVGAALRGEAPGIDLVLMDIDLPGCDGLTAARSIRGIAGEGERGADSPCPPLVALTAGAFADDRQRCFDAGLQDWLAKPFTRADFERVLARWLPDGGAPHRARGLG